MSTTATDFFSQAERDNVAAIKYLAFLDSERLALIAELYPDALKGDGYFVPIDNDLMALSEASPLSRARPVLEALGIDPDTNDNWAGWLPAGYVAMRANKQKPS